MTDGLCYVGLTNSGRAAQNQTSMVQDNVYVERLWRRKYEDIYLKSYETMKELKEGVKRYFEFYNSERFHQSHNYNTPMYESFSRMGKEENVA